MMKSKKKIALMLSVLMFFSLIFGMSHVAYAEKVVGKESVSLDLNQNKLEDLTDTDKIKRLELNNYKNEDFTPLPEMKNLEELSVISHYDDGSLSSLKGIERFGNLKKLGVDNQKLTDLQGVENLQNLEHISFMSNMVKDLTPLVNLPRLKFMNYGLNPIEKGLDDLANIGRSYFYLPRSTEMKFNKEENAYEITMPILKDENGKELQIVRSDIPKPTDSNNTNIQPMPYIPHFVGHDISLSIKENKVYLGEKDYIGFKMYRSFPLVAYVKADDPNYIVVFGIVDFPNLVVQTEDKATDTSDLVETKDEAVGEDLSNDKATQTEEQANLSEVDKLKKEVEDLTKKLDENKGLSDKQKEEIKQLNEKLKNLKDKTSSKDTSEDVKNKVSELEKKYQTLEDKVNKSNTSTQGPAITGMAKSVTGGQTGSGTKISSTPASGTGSTITTSKLSSTDVSKSVEETNKNDDKSVRYPNKLTPKQPANSTQNMSTDGQSQNVSTNKGVASAPSKARGTVTENKDNGNKDYPIHHGDGSDLSCYDVYSADARQFVTFTTKNGKTFHLIINHDEDSENVMLLTEVSEDDLLNMVEKKEVKQEVPVQKEEPKEEQKTTSKKEESSNMGTYLILGLVILGALGAGYYFKVVKKKEEKELEGFEEAEEDDDFFTEVVDLDEIDDVEETDLDEVEVDKIDETEE